MLFKRKSKYDYIIAGLGNPTPKYAKNRHNIGFMFIDRLIKDMSLGRGKSKFSAEVFDADILGKKCLLLKPQEYMNNSGRSVEAAAAYFKVPITNIIVVFDDVSLPPGRVRFRPKGSAGGHNGVKDIIECTGSEDFPRIKIGVGGKPHPEYDLARWVLSDIPKEEFKIIDKAIEEGIMTLNKILSGKIIN